MIISYQRDNALTVPSTRASILPNGTGAVRCFRPRPSPIPIFGELPHSEGRGGGAMTPPVCEWAAGSCSLSRWSEVFGEEESVGGTDGAELWDIKPPLFIFHIKKPVESWLPVGSPHSSFYLLTRHFSASSRKSVSTSLPFPFETVWSEIEKQPIASPHLMSQEVGIFFKLRVFSHCQA